MEVGNGDYLCGEVRIWSVSLDNYIIVTIIIDKIFIVNR